MTFTLSADQQEIRAAVFRLCERFGDEYWLKKDTEGGFPHEFHRAMAEAGWLGIDLTSALPVGVSLIWVCAAAHGVHQQAASARIARTRASRLNVPSPGPGLAAARRRRNPRAE